MDEHTHHENLIKGITAQFKEILENSNQGIYIYLDDSHKVCNKNFSSLLGYKTPLEWAKNKESFTDLFVEDDSAERLVTAYRNSMEKNIGSQIKVTWKKKTGGTVKTDVILVPIAFEGHLFALHFVTFSKTK